MLTELEGAILSEIEHRGQKTAFQVRRAFAVSTSLEWKGSAGSIYPAIRRLERRGLICATAPEGGRGTRNLSLAQAGKEALTMWASDPVRGASIGIDPFRLRAGIWMAMPSRERNKVLRGLEREIAASIPLLETLQGQTDPIERVRLALGVALQRARLAFLREWLSQHRSRLRDFDTSRSLS